MASKFTSQEAFNASKAGEPILIDRAWVAKVCGQHNADSDEFFADNPHLADLFQLDAAHVLAWLGY